MARAAEALGVRATRAASMKAARAKLASVTESLRRAGGASVASRLAVGSVREEILRAAGQSDLLVVGARGGNPLRNALLGSTAERLVQTGRGPILVVKARASRPYREVVVGHDFSDDADSALDMALGIAPHARITLVHAHEMAFEGMLWRGAVPERQRETLRARARSETLAKMHALVASLGKRAERVRYAVGRGYPPRVVLDAARRRDADLIVVGKQGRSTLEELFIGSLTRHILADSRCDVLVSRRNAPRRRGLSP
jgi:nucleotide-binding universal stress UspA family protein